MKDRRVPEMHLCAKCGAPFRPLIHSLRAGRGRYCSKRCGVQGVTTHGDAAGRKSAEYRAWRHMRSRCLNPNTPDFRLYGGRGIKVCESWSEFVSFLADMGRRPSASHSLDRVNPDGNYEPSNCRWATASEQANNRRKTIRVQYHGESLTITECAQRLGIHRETLKRRLQTMSLNYALTPGLMRKRADPEWFKDEAEQARAAA